MSLRHEFYRLNDRAISTPDMTMVYRESLDSDCKADISDDLFSYILDTLRWVPSFNPDTNEFSLGFNYWGNTIIEGHGLDVLLGILRGWLIIFETADETVVLKGRFTWDEERESGAYEHNKFNKTEILRSISRFIDLVDTVRLTDDFIWHMGI